LQPPLYHLLLRFWRDILGDGPGRLRAFSAVMSLAAVALTFEAGRRSAGAGPGLWAAAMMAASLSQVDQAHDARGYTLLLVVSLATAIALLSLQRENLDSRGIAWRAGLVGTGVLAMMFTHYFAAGACVALGAYAAIFLRGRARWMTLAAMAVAAVIWCALWLPSLRDQLAAVKETADVFLADPGPGHVGRTLRRLAAMPMTLLADTDPAEQASPPRVFLGLMLLAIAAAAVFRHRRATALWTLWLIGTIGLVAALDLARQTLHLTFARYVLLASPAL